jgi:hypothetical protein
MEVLRFMGRSLVGLHLRGSEKEFGCSFGDTLQDSRQAREQQVLQKTEHGYQVTERGKEVTGLKQLSSAGPRVTLLRTLLPQVDNPREAISALRGRWFGPLRWLGYSEDEKGTNMKWVTEDGGIQVDAIFAEGELTIEGRIREGKDLTDAIKASHQLVGYISRVYPNKSNSRVAFYTPQTFFIAN